MCFSRVAQSCSLLEMGTIPFLVSERLRTGAHPHRRRSNGEKCQYLQKSPLETCKSGNTGPSPNDDLRFMNDELVPSVFLD